MSKKNTPLQLEASLDLTEEGAQVLIEVTCTDGRALTPQIILDAVADMLTAKYGMVGSEWDYPTEELDS